MKQPRGFNGDMTIVTEDGAVTVGRGFGEQAGEFFMEGVVNDEGGYISVTLTEAQLRTLVAYIDNIKASVTATA